MPSCMQRKYIDLILEMSSKWANWDPPIQVKVGSYGTIDKETGDLLVEGNVYDAEFQDELDKHGVNIRMANYPPQEGPVEGDFLIASRGAKRQDVDNANDIHGIANAYIKGQWLFERGKRDAILIMHSPRQVYLPTDVVLEHLYQVDKLVNKHLVTNVHNCPAYSMYLSDKSGDRVSIALTAQQPTAGVAVVTAGTSNQSFTWWVDPQTGFHRKGCDQTGDYKFTPLYTLKRPIKRYRRFFRDPILPKPSGDDLWHLSSPPWDPLDEDGAEDPFSPDVRNVDPFAPVTPPGMIHNEDSVNRSI